MITLPRLTYRAVAAFAGAVALPGGGALAGVAGADSPPPAAVSAAAPEVSSESSSPSPSDPPASESTTAATGAGADAAPELTCLSRTICAVKEKIRWQTSAWTPSECQRIAAAVLSSAKRHGLSPTLLLAVMINESDMNEKSARVSTRGEKVYAKDSGLMAIRCVLGQHDRCLNGNVRGLAWKDVMDPATNIELGARELAHWRDGGAVTRVVVKRRDAGGVVRPVWKTVPCRHLDHAYWAHYNHGPRYISTGFPRHYPHRVAVLDHALATVMNIDAPELASKHITIQDRGKRARTVDRPLEARYKKLCSQIQSVGSCSAVALN